MATSDDDEDDDDDVQVDNDGERLFGDCTSNRHRSKLSNERNCQVSQ